MHKQTKEENQKNKKSKKDKHILKFHSLIVLYIITDNSHGNNNNTIIEILPLDDKSTGQKTADNIHDNTIYVLNRPLNENFTPVPKKKNT